MTLTQLKYLVAVAETRHFGEAARRCGVTQPTLSMQLHRLERALGLTLFDRRQKPVEPTEAGHAIIAQARRVLYECGRLEALAQEASGVMTGELRLGIIPTLAPYLLPLVVPTFTRRHPGIRLRIRERTTAEIISDLSNGQLDAGLASEHEASPHLSSRVLFREPFVAFVAPEHRLAEQTTIPLEALTLDDVWLLSDGHCFRDQVQRLCRETERAHADLRPLRFESGNLETLVRLVKTAGGMTLLPYLATYGLSEPDKRTYLRALTPTPVRDVRLLTGRHLPQQKLLGALIAVIVELAGQALPDSHGHSSSTGLGDF